MKAFDGKSIVLPVSPAGWDSIFPAGDISRDLPARVADIVISARCVLLGYNPIRHPVGVFPCGSPGPDSPVVVSGNYFHTVKRLMRTLKDCDCHILVADSAGINVWCAAGVGDFNEHKISDAVNSLGLSEALSHRILILPQLAAVGIDLAVLERECGFRGRWGPCSMEDLPAFLAVGAGEVSTGMRLARFSLFDRFCNAVGMFNAFLIIPLVLALAGRRREAHFAGMMNFMVIFGTFLFLPGPKAVYPSTFAIMTGLAATLTGLIPGSSASRLLPGRAMRMAIGLFTTLLVTIDMLGSTPWYKTTMESWLSTGTMESLFQPCVTDRCIGCGICASVCPKGLFRIVAAVEKKGLVARADRAAGCCECLACVKQCPARAIRNVGSWPIKDDIKSISDLDEKLDSNANRTEG